MSERVPVWRDNPLEGGRRRPDAIIKIPAGHETTVVILCHRPGGAETHFVGNRTVPCTGEQGECHLDHTKTTARRWQGWLAVMTRYGPAPLYVALTPAVAEQIPELVDGHTDLRGRGLMLWRRGKTDQTAMQGRLIPNPWPGLPLAPAVDMRTWLLRLWGPILRNGAEPRWTPEGMEPRPHDMAELAQTQADIDPCPEDWSRVIPPLPSDGVADRVKGGKSR